MDGTRFDALVRLISTSKPRRGLLKGLLAGAGAGLLAGRAAPEPVAAADDRKCEGKPAIDDKRCPETSVCKMRPNAVCNCFETRNGSKKCLDVTGEECPTTDECDRDDD